GEATDTTRESRNKTEHAYADGNDCDVVQNTDAHTDQGADSGCFCGSGALIFPHQVQNQTNDGNTTAQQSPKEPAVVNHIGPGLLGNTAVRADNRLVVDALSAISTIRHEYTSLFLCTGLGNPCL